MGYLHRLNQLFCSVLFLDLFIHHFFYTFVLVCAIIIIIIIIIIVRDVGDAVRTQRSGGQPEYEPIRAACNQLAQLSTCTYLLQRRCDSGERVCAAPRYSLREALYCVCVSLVIY